MTSLQRWHLHTNVTIWGFVVLGTAILLGSYLGWWRNPQTTAHIGASVVCYLASIGFAISRYVTLQRWNATAKREMRDENPTDVCVQDTDG